MIAIIDVTGNNLTSLVNSIRRLGFDCVLTHSQEQILQASHVILPGVGAAPIAMQALHEHQLVQVLQQLQQPLLGICLGMQLLFEHSQEGNVACLGVLNGEVERIPSKKGFSVPHMGWNRLHWCRDSVLGEYVYFVHGFAVRLTEYTVASCQYSMDFSAVVQKDNIFGMQFHPEKSAGAGLKLLQNFLDLTVPFM